MTEEQIKEALLGDWLEHAHVSLKDDCDLANELKETIALGILYHLMCTEPIHAVVHLMIASCRFGYEYRKREEGASALEKLYNLGDNE